MTKEQDIFHRSNINSKNKHDEKSANYSHDERAKHFMAQTVKAYAKTKIVTIINEKSQLITLPKSATVFIAQTKK